MTNALLDWTGNIMSLSLLLSALKYVVEKCWTVLFNNNKGISRVVFTIGYKWNNDGKMPLVKSSDINWQILFMGLQKETGTSNIV